MDSQSPLHLNSASSNWPREFDTLDAPPNEIWVRGSELALAPAPRIAIVGSRAPTPYGLAQARRFAERLAGVGLCIVSGLARGIDHAAHSGALDAGGTTIAVLGSGVDRPWPADSLSDRIAAEGTLVSEYSPGTAPRRHHFPLRNRLISALSMAVVVVEAARASGSLITARWAADQGRAVFALPGRIDHPMARGCHRLIREGATLVESPEQLLRDLELFETVPEAEGASSDSDPEGNAAARELHPIESQLSGETLDLDELCARLGQPVSEVSVELIGLELDGRIVRGPGGLFRLA